MEEPKTATGAADTKEPMQASSAPQAPDGTAAQLRREAMMQAAAQQPNRPGPRKPREERDGGENDAPEKGGRKRRRHGVGHGISIRLILILVLLIVLVVAVMLLYSSLKEGLKSPVSDLDITVPASLEGLLPDEKMGYNKIDFTNAILGESRERQELIVLEQDVEVTTQVSQALANIALFAKTKTLISHGTGVYTVSFHDVGESSIQVDEEKQLVTMTIPHTTLQYIDFDVTNTESGETQKALLAIGEIKLTAEQDLELKTAIHTSMEEKLSTPAMFTKADEAALKKVVEIFEPLVKAVSPDFVFKAVMAEA